MLNRSKRYEREEQKEKEMEYQDLQKNTIMKLKDEVESLKCELAELQAKNYEADRNADILSKLFEQKITDDKGNVMDEE